MDHDRNNPPASGPCTHCGEDTGEGRFWCDGCDEADVPSEWVFCHHRCAAMMVLRMEERALQDLRDNPGDRDKQVLARLFGGMADRAVKRFREEETS